MSRRLFTSRMQPNVSARDEAAVRCVGELVGDSTDEHLAQVEATRHERLAQAQAACRERRARLDFIAAHPAAPMPAHLPGPVPIRSLIAHVMGDIAQRVAACHPEDNSTAHAS